MEKKSCANTKAIVGADRSSSTRRSRSRRLRLRHRRHRPDEDNGEEVARPSVQKRVILNRLV
jgi:hypothetical protein